jgi:molecular chaperone GrpE
MSEKKRHNHKDEEVVPDNPQEPENLAATEKGKTVKIEVEADELESLRQKLAEAEAKAVENLDGWQRAVAEFQNYKKRMDRDREAEKAWMKGELVRKVLPVLDDLERALLNRPAGDPWANGIELITRKLQSILEAEGIERIEAQGKAFDPNYHEAISYEPSAGVESGSVIAIIQNGYMLGDRVVRPALVRVAK